MFFPRYFIRGVIPSRVEMMKTLSLYMNFVSGFGIIVFPFLDTAMTLNWKPDVAATAAKSASFRSKRGESSSILNTSIWSFPCPRSMASVACECLSISTISSAASFSGWNMSSMPICLNNSLFSGAKNSSSSILAVTFFAPRFLAIRALTMFTS